MASITLGQRTLYCQDGDNLRQVLLQAGVGLYNGPAKVVNCLGLGTCGTCAVAVSGPVSEPSLAEKLRAPLLKGRRLACQTTVLGDLTVVKYEGTWGLGQKPVPWQVQQ